jgi:hypothetical protein
MLLEDNWTLPYAPACLKKWGWGSVAITRDIDEMWVNLGFSEHIRNEPLK